MREMPVVLSVAGSDSGGGAGIQADLKTFGALGVFGTTAITAVTAQNTAGVQRVDALPPDAVAAQIDAVATDFRIAAVKVGMLADEGIIEAVAERIRAHGLDPVVIDPVCVAGSGDPLLAPDALGALRDRMLPLATILTPNISEATLLTGQDLSGDSDEELVSAAQTLLAAGARAVFLKGGHRTGDADDLWVDEEGTLVLTAERVPGNASHGTGCSLSSAVAAFLARGRTPRQAAKEAKEFVRRAILDAVQLGSAQSNLHHYWEYYGREGLP